MFRRSTQMLSLSLAVVFLGGCLAHSVAGILVTAFEVHCPAGAATVIKRAGSSASLGARLGLSSEMALCSVIV
jgi:hypothetical protein